jgi:NADP-dependent 3-hydroxy acid dehydrogenase YdfG
LGYLIAKTLLSKVVIAINGRTSEKINASADHARNPDQGFLLAGDVTQPNVPENWFRSQRKTRRVDILVCNAWGPHREPLNPLTKPPQKGHRPFFHEHVRLIKAKPCS